ncbi:MAG: hypothetical protein HY791_33085 [Deltaproteobacteria bacterium]|nr:hypothetical protein [Deltaproteobacteria bacterium]
MPKLELRGRIEDDLVALLGEQLAGISAEDGSVEIDLEHARIDEPAVAKSVAEVLLEGGDRLGPIRVIGAPAELRALIDGDARVTLA